MKSKLLLLIALVITGMNAWTQYTPLPALDETAYENFVTILRQQADEQGVPELKNVADNMTYDEARRFMANPHVFAEKLKNQEKKDGMDALEAVRFGIIFKLLYSHFTGLSDAFDSSPRLGFALGLYAMFVLGTVYLMPELLFMHRVAAQEYSFSQTTFENILQVSYAVLFMNLMYAIQATNIRWLLGGGPAFAFGLSGKEKFKDGTQTDEETVDFGDDGLRRFQFGINLQVGVAMASGFMIFLGYTYYISKLFTDNDDIGMNSFRLGLAYLFAASRKGTQPEASLYNP